MTLRGHTAAGALLGIDLRHAVHDVDGVKAADRDARAEAEAAARAGRGAVAADEHGGAAVVDAVVAGLGGVVAAAADHGDDALGLCGRDAHDGGHPVLFAVLRLRDPGCELHHLARQRRNHALCPIKKDNV